MSQPPLTRIISEAERFLGARLFERTTRRVSLTPVGEVLVVEARAVLTRADTALESVQAAVRRQAGQLRLAYTSAALQTVLPEILSELREREHEVRIDLVELAGEAQREALRNGNIDMGFFDEPLESAGFVSLLLHKEGLQVVLPDTHPLAWRGLLRLPDLADETFILHARQENPAYYDRVLKACQEAGFSPRIYHREARQNCPALVAAGQGVLLAPTTHPHVSVPGFRRVPLEAPSALYWEVWAILPAASGSPYLKALRDVIQARESKKP